MAEKENELNAELLNIWKNAAQKSDHSVRIYAEDLLAIIAGAERALLAAAPAPIQQAPQATLICPTCGKDRFKDPCPNMADECSMVADAHLLAPPALAGSQVQAAGDEVNEREAFESMVKERFVTTQHSLARAHPYGYYNTVSSNTFGGRRQPDYANVQMLWDVWDARATIAKKAMREQP